MCDRNEARQRKPQRRFAARRPNRARRPLDEPRERSKEPIAARHHVAEQRHEEVVPCTITCTIRRDGCIREVARSCVALVLRDTRLWCTTITTEITVARAHLLPKRLLLAPLKMAGRTGISALACLRVALPPMSSRTRHCPVAIFESPSEESKEFGTDMFSNVESEMDEMLEGKTSIKVAEKSEAPTVVVDSRLADLQQRVAKS